MMPPKVLDRQTLIEKVRKLKSQGKTVVTTNGCFDILHVGHARYLQAARQLGDALVVLVNSDDSVRCLKGPQRPIVPQDERAEMLAALACVDYVAIFPEDTPIPWLKELRPDMHVKGGDYRLEDIPERAVVEAGGGRMVIGVNVAGKSTTDLLEHIQACCSK